MFSREEMLERVREQMNENRFQHTLGVASTAVELAKRYGADPSKADLAGILHDFCKFWSGERLKECIERYGLTPELLDYDKELWHGPVGAEVVREQFTVTDEDVLNAIRYHTSGREGMSLLEKIVCLADYIEPGRDFPGIEGLRAKAEQSLDEALRMSFDNTIRFLLDRGKTIYPLTLLARNAFLKEARMKEDEA